MMKKNIMLDTMFLLYEKVTKSFENGLEVNSVVALQSISSCPFFLVVSETIKR